MALPISPAGAAWARAERDLVLVDSKHHERRRSCCSRSDVTAAAKSLHQVPDVGSYLFMCLWRTAVWSGRVRVDAAFRLSHNIVCIGTSK